MSIIQRLKNIFMKPDVSDQERIERWKTEVDEADRLKELQRKSRKQGKKGLIKKKGLTVEDFEKVEQANKKKEIRKPISYNF
jgi:hypothetical protein